jgi:hypothetical protein
MADESNPFDPKHYGRFDLNFDTYTSGGELKTPLDWYQQFRWRGGFNGGLTISPQAGEICDQMVACINWWMWEKGIKLKAYITTCKDHDLYIEYAVPEGEPAELAALVLRQSEEEKVRK